MPLPSSGDFLPAPTTRGIPAGARRVVLLAALLALPTTAGVALSIGTSMAVGVLAGALLALGNFWVLSRLVVKATAETDVHWGTLTARLLLKFSVLGFALFLLIVLLAVDVLGIAIGLSLVMFAAILSQLVDMVA